MALAASGHAQTNPSGATTPVLAGAAETHRFAIAPQALTTALVEFSNATGIQFFFDAAIARGLTSPGASGNLSTDAALRTLLAGTGLTYRFTNPTTVTLEKQESTTGAMALPAVQVEGQGSTETATGPVQGYIARQSATATKTDTPLLETPQAVSVIGREQVEAQGAQTVAQATHYTPGVTAGQDPVENRFDSILIRGFGPVIYLDGMELPHGITGFGEPVVDPFGLERIEILRGPSSALYGQLPPGGMVNLVSLRPPADATHAVELQGNNFGNIQGAFDIGGPATQDGTLLYRLTGLVHGGGTQIDHVDDEREMIAPAFTWRPDADTSFTFLSQYQRDHSGVEIQFLPAQGTLLPNPNGTVPVGRFLGEPGYDGYRRTQYWVGYQFEHRFDDAWTVRQNFRYANLDTKVFAVIGGGLQSDLKTLNRFTYYVPEKAQNITLDNQAEAHFATGLLTHTALFGLDYRWDDGRTQRGIGAAPPLDIFNPVYGAAITPPAITFSTGQNQDQIGTYLQDQIALDRWRLTLSGRHDWLDTTTNDFIAGTRQGQDNRAFSGRAGLNYVFDLGLSPYVSFAHSFQPTIGTDFSGAPFQPTTADQYEAGVKYRPLGPNLAMNAAAYHLTEQNALTADGAHVGFQTQAGEIRVQGIELDATANLTDGLNLIAAYTYTDAQNTKGAASTIGKQVIDVPRHAASLWVDYTQPTGPWRGFGGGGGIRYFGDTYGDAANTLRIPDYTLVDATLHYDLGQLRPELAGAKLTLNASNLFDKRYVTNCTSLSACYYGTARTVTVALRYSW
ncbi:MAG TPA: TonB-dependent siderophore receptor [Stellaceae bacterium]|nr:TonB-dependent siderophore receptor [Stellaceae bacterium]